MLTSIVSAFLGVVLGTTALPSSFPTPVEVSLHEWMPEAGDTFFVDTAENMGYLVHRDGTYTSFEVVTGQRRRVHYIGRSYNATTPTLVWTAKARDIKGDRLTFGKTGRFIRLFDDDGERTAYGIHGYGREDDMFSQDSRFQSMGCIIVREEVLNVIEKTYELSGESMTVVTSYGLHALPDEIGFSLDVNTQKS